MTGLITDVPILFNGDYIDAAWINGYLGDNVRALLEGFGAAGNIPYAGANDTIAGLAKPSVDSWMKNTSAGVPSWEAIAAFPGRLHTWGIVTSGTERTTSSATVSDVTGMSTNLILSTTCTIIAIAIGMHYMDAATQEPRFLINIDGTDDPNVYSSKKETEFNAGAPFHTIYSRTGISSGTRAVKLRFRLSSSGDTLRFKNGTLLALAFAE